MTHLPAISYITDLSERIAAIVEGIWEQVKSPALNTVRVTDAVVLLTRLRQKENAMNVRHTLFVCVWVGGWVGVFCVWV
jgi:hypothetical protein